MTIKDIAVTVFSTLSKDTKLLQLLDVASSAMKDVKEQMLEDRYPNDLIENNLSRICIYELPSTPTFNQYIEKGWIEVDIYVTKEKDRIDRRVLLIVQHIIELLDANERRKKGLDPVVAGIGLNYYNRLPNMQTDRPEWKKYGLVFNYDILRV